MIIQKIINIDDTYFDVFMSISEALTGFTEFELQATGLGKIYYDYLNNNIARNSFYQFLAESNDLIVNTNLDKTLPEKFGGNTPDAIEYTDIAKKIITLWYMGTWEGAYVAGESYKEGLIWKAIYSHPPGAKQPGFGTWSLNPVEENL